MIEEQHRSRHVTTIAYRLEDEKGNMPYDTDKRYMTAYTNPAEFASGYYKRFLTKDKYSIYEYIICVEEKNIKDGGVVKFKLWNALSKDKVY